MNQTMKVNGYAISYNKIGCGAHNAVLIHGWGASKSWWQEIAQGLAETHTCYMPDLVGFGQSTKPVEPRPFHIEEQVKTLANLIEALQIAPVYLVGHSMGGMISVTLAHRYPYLVERLAVIDLVVTGRCHSFLRAGQLALKFPILGRHLFSLGHGVNRWIRTAYTYSFYAMLARKSGLKKQAVKAFIARTYADYRALPTRSLQFALQAFTTFDLRPFMAEVTQPTLVICGKEDKQIPPEDSQILAEALPQACLEWLSPAGHNPFVEYPDCCLNLLQSFANGRKGYVTSAKPPISIPTRASEFYELSEPP